MARRGVRLAREITEDPYIKTPLALCHTQPPRHLPDRLLRGPPLERPRAERLPPVWVAIENDADLKDFYHHLWASEAKHGNIFVKMALQYFPRDQVYSRLSELNEAEGRIVLSLNRRSALH